MLPFTEMGRLGGSTDFRMSSDYSFEHIGFGLLIKHSSEDIK